VPRMLHIEGRAWKPLVGIDVYLEGHSSCILCCRSAVTPVGPAWQRNVGVVNLCRIAEALNMSLAELFAEVESTEPRDDD
jgi:hypothetical protein